MKYAILQVITLIVSNVALAGSDCSNVLNSLLEHTEKHHQLIHSYRVLQLHPSSTFISVSNLGDSVLVFKLERMFEEALKVLQPFDATKSDFRKGNYIEEIEVGFFRITLKEDIEYTTNHSSRLNNMINFEDWSFDISRLFAEYKNKNKTPVKIEYFHYHPTVTPLSVQDIKTSEWFAAKIRKYFGNPQIEYEISSLGFDSIPFSYVSQRMRNSGVTGYGGGTPSANSSIEKKLPFEALLNTYSVPRASVND
ncbi:MAG: hypothetical protein KDD35_05150 [Bdellovibrionales bacterium]|nr:hypothetical protein [Bdellovibrionales bacterium]